MPAATVYHNPRCSKSRQTLALLEARSVELTVVRYLDTPPDEKTLRDLLGKLGIGPAGLIRRKEKAFTELGLAGQLDDDPALIAAMLAHPELIERPIVVIGNHAVIARPPERVLTLV